MKALIKYSNWLIKTRGEIRPEVGDITHYIINDLDLKKGETKDNVVTEETIYHFKLGILKFDRYFGNSYVEMDLPEIEYEDDINGNYVGSIGRLHIVTLSEGNDNKWHLWNSAVGNYLLFSGTLIECKQKAEELLWKAK